MENNTLQEKEVKKEAFLIHLFSIIKLHWIAISVSVVTIVVLTSIYVLVYLERIIQKRSSCQRHPHLQLVFLAILEQWLQWQVLS